VDDAFVRCTVACMMWIPFGFENWMYYYHIATVFVNVKTEAKETKNGFREAH
jgi:hypothetical protein